MCIKNKTCIFTLIAKSQESCAEKWIWTETDGCLSEALKYWKLIEDISIGPLGNGELIAKLLQLREFSMTRGAATKGGPSMNLSQCKQLSKFTLKSLYAIPRKKDKICIQMEKKIITNMAGGDEYIKWCVKYFVVPVILNLF
ncbi:hypothetical protein PanWU01x14_253770 [Parasponia andersonii]|uniref:Uncharacterized protein n=1 Tax=Parasponia andersonii TaxID=3476 RepID=A0A2P5BBI0_PARAD|nr:hypothetical protein PanWU01x14_253770 [Parasponia andersonii]